MTMAAGKRDILERLSWWLTLTACLTALLACIVAPLLAISWSKHPFPGFMVEPTLIVNDSDGDGWSSQSTGFSFGQRVVRLAGQAVATSAEYDAMLANYEPGQQMSVFTRSPDGIGTPLSRDHAHALPQRGPGAPVLAALLRWTGLFRHWGVDLQSKGVHAARARALPSSVSACRSRARSTSTPRRPMSDRPSGPRQSRCSAGRCSAWPYAFLRSCSRSAAGPGFSACPIASRSFWPGWGFGR